MSNLNPFLAKLFVPKDSSGEKLLTEEYKLAFEKFVVKLFRYTGRMDLGLFLMIYFILCILIGGAASGKGRGAVAWMFISFIITPVLGGFFVAFMKNKEEES